MDTLEAIEQISTDFDEGNPPFDDVTFPEERLLEKLKPRTMEQKMRVISMFCMFDYNRNASQLVDNLIELWNSPARFLFKPHKVPPADEFQDTFERIGFRYPSRDASGLQKNSQILLNNYHGSWNELLLSVSADAPNLVQQLEDDGFLYLKGVKIAPMYARIINDEVCPLTNMWELDIPVDTHIRRLSKDLFTNHFINCVDPSDDEIRGLWRQVASEQDVDRHTVDGALWHIGNKWNDWGEDYWNSL